MTVQFILWDRAHWKFPYPFLCFRLILTSAKILIMTFRHKMHLITIIIAWTICPTGHKIESPEDTCPPGPCPSLCFTSRQSHNLTIFKHLNPKQDKTKYFFKLDQKIHFWTRCRFDCRREIDLWTTKCSIVMALQCKVSHKIIGKSVIYGE